MSGFDLVTADAPLLLAGCGKMGSALLKGWLGQGLNPEAVYIIEPGSLDLAAEFAGFSLAPEAVVASASALPAGLAPAVMVLAVKPQAMDEALRPLAAFVKAGSGVVSIAAGKTIDYFAKKLGDEASVIRAMPNTPAAIGRGMTVAFANANVSPAQKALCEAMMTAVGKFAWLEEESLIDAVTAVSGSGPAYVFYLAECLAAAGKTAGLPDDLAQLLAVETVIGAGALLAASGEAPHDLRRNVTSPKGTTEAALDILMAEEGMADLLRKAVAAAAKRSRELAS
jgi:pyrroline-5-carboxylate reductase